MDFKIVRHTPFEAVYLYADPVKAIRKVRALQTAGAHFVILDNRNSLPLSVDELEQAARR